MANDEGREIAIQVRLAKDEDIMRDRYIASSCMVGHKLVGL